jgi:hypothetical protein
MKNILLKARYQEHGKFGLDGEGLQALRAFAELHEAQVRTTTHGELEDAIKEMHRRIKAGNHFAIREAA